MTQGPMTRAGIDLAFHYAPLHYIPFILRSNHLRCKSRLLAEGFARSHFRSTSARQDLQRGFGDYVHLALDPHPPILRAKLRHGFPHVEIAVPATTIEQNDYLLCRFNIAKTRYFRGAKIEPLASESNGEYLGGLRLPVAHSVKQKKSLLEHNLGRQIIEVLVKDELLLPPGCVITVFSAQDLDVVSEASERIRTVPIDIKVNNDMEYPDNAKYREAAMLAFARTLDDPDWKGEGLEFDRV